MTTIAQMKPGDKIVKPGTEIILTFCQAENKDDYTHVVWETGGKYIAMRLEKHGRDYEFNLLS